jgi:hypothetical protein
MTSYITLIVVISHQSRHYSNPEHSTHTNDFRSAAIPSRNRSEAVDPASLIYSMFIGLNVFLLPTMKLLLPANKQQFFTKQSASRNLRVWSSYQLHQFGMPVGLRSSWSWLLFIRFLCACMTEIRTIEKTLWWLVYVMKMFLMQLKLRWRWASLNNNQQCAVGNDMKVDGLTGPLPAIK